MCRTGRAGALGCCRRAQRLPARADGPNIWEQPGPDGPARGGDAMTFLADLAAYSLLAFAALVLAAQIVAREVGYLLGQHRAGQKEKADEGIGVVTGSILGLLAFVLAFNLSIATTRHSERRLASLEEANAIGTSWLQAKVIDTAHAAAIARLLEDYTAERIVFVHAERNSPVIAESVARTAAMQTRIWGHVTALVRDAPGPVSASLMNAVNHTFDMTTAMRFAMAYAMPPQLIWLLLALSCIGMGVLGYQFGLTGRHHRVLSILASVLWTAVVVEIFDIGSPRLGSFRTDAYAYDWTIAGFGDIPVPVAE
jgi:hypothetical protein